MRKTTKQQARKEINSSFQIVNACFIKSQISLSIFGHQTFFNLTKLSGRTRKKKTWGCEATAKKIGVAMEVGNDGVAVITISNPPVNFLASKAYIILGLSRF